MVAPKNLPPCDMMTLLDEHDRLDALASKAIFTARADDAGAFACRTVLDDIAAIMADHLATEDAVVRSMGIEEGQPYPEDLAAFVRDADMLEAQWDAYLDFWTADQIARDRSGFAAATGDMMTALKLRIEQENSLLYPLMLDAGRIPLRPRA